MSIAHLVEEARLRGERDLDGRLVIFDGRDGRISLTLEWSPSWGRWKATAASEGISQSYIAPSSVEGVPAHVAAVAGALNAYLDVVNGRTVHRTNRIVAADRFVSEARS